MADKIRVGITHGDYNGVGYEVILKALADETVTELFTPVLYGIPGLVENTATLLGLELPETRVIKEAGEAEDGVLNIVDLGLRDITPDYGHPTPASGRAAVIALERAVKDIQAGDIDTLVTAPINKEAVQSDKFHFAGHTEFLGERSGSKPRMILFSDTLRVALLTTHKAVGEIAASVTKDAVTEAIREFDASLRRDYGIQRPKIAVLALNPHCGDGGLIGKEEISEIAPALEEVAETHLAFGPFAADGFFASMAWKKYDGVLAMYHDQGLAPFKALAGSEGVNFTAGLPFVRTSPDHGTACDIAGKGLADPTSMRQAIYASIDIFRNRQRHDEARSNPLPKLPERPDKGERKQPGKPSEPKNTEPKNTESKSKES